MNYYQPGMSLTTTTVSADSDREEITPGDIVAVRHGYKGRQEGLVIGSHVDYLGRQVIEVQLEGEVFYTWRNPLLPGSVTRVKRVISYSRPTAHHVQRVERRILW